MTVTDMETDSTKSNGDMMLSSLQGSVTPGAETPRNEVDNNEIKCSKPADTSVSTWRNFQDIIMFAAGMCFIIILIGAMFGIGIARSWNATTGILYNETITTSYRFLPEPSDPDPYPSVKGRVGRTDAQAYWYFWKNKPEDVSAWTRLFAWGCYLLHQISVWIVLYLGQRHRATSSGPRYSSVLNKYNWIMFALNTFFHLIHLMQTHLTYDALAQDVLVTSSQSAVIMLLVVIIVMEYSERGLFFGWPSSTHHGKWTDRLRLNQRPVYLLRKYHGYAFAWASIYTFWYHPMENTYGHALGFAHTWSIMLQGSLMFSPLHLNRWWRFLLESWVTLHGGLVAYMTAAGSDDLWPMFVFGFLLNLVLTWIFILPFWARIPAWTRVLPLLAYIGATVGAYSQITNENGQAFVRMAEVIRIPLILYGCFFVAWGFLYFALWLDGIAHRNDVSNDVSIPVKVVYTIGFVVVYALLMLLSALLELYAVSMMFFIMMIILIVIFIIGACIATMFLKYLVPAKKIAGPDKNSCVDNKAFAADTKEQ